MPPTDIQDGERRKLKLLEELNDIQRQLGDRNRTGADGQRMDDDVYWTWRKHAVAALNFKHAEVRRINAWLKERRNAAEAELQRAKAKEGGIEFDNGDPISMLRAAYGVMARMLKDLEDGLDDDEYSLFIAMQNYLREH